VAAKPLEIIMFAIIDERKICRMTKDGKPIYERWYYLYTHHTNDLIDFPEDEDLIFGSLSNTLKYIENHKLKWLHTFHDYTDFEDLYKIAYNNWLEKQE
jgi:hypothetical protein